VRNRAGTGHRLRPTVGTITTLKAARAGFDLEGLPRIAPMNLKRFRDRYREVALSVILALQATIMFVVSPLAGAGLITGGTIEGLRFAMAATAILVVSRNRLVGACVGATFAVSLACTIFLKSGVAGQATYLTNIVITIAFDLAVAWTVAHAAFGPGRITVHRIMGAIILYLYIGLIFASAYRLAAATLHETVSPGAGEDGE